MAEFSDVPTNVVCLANVANLLPLDEDELGVSAAGLNAMLSAARSSNVHTKPPPQSGDKSNRKTVDRLQQTVHASCHLNVFLRLYIYEPLVVAIDEAAMRDCLNLCVNNEPEWVHGCQVAALKILMHEVDATATAAPKPDDPVLLAQLRSALSSPSRKAASVPSTRISTSTPHFRFVVDTALEESKDRYFSAQVKFKCESKGPVVVKIAQRMSLIDGVRLQDGTDFQCLLDKSTFKKGESCTLMLSLIAKPCAVFRTIQEMLVVSFNDAIRVVCTFVVVNPSAPLYGTSLPCCVTQAVTASPLGVTYHAPLFLQVLKHQFVRQQGYACKDVGHLLCGHSHMYAPQNRDVLRQASRIIAQLDDAMNIGDVLHQYWVAQSGADSAAVGSAGAKGASYLIIPPSTPQPPGYAVGATVPSASQASLSTFPNVQTPLPDVLVAASPSVIMSLVLTWLSAFPVPILDASVAACDPMAFLELLQPWQQGIVWWVVELCCGLLLYRSDTDVSIRTLALTFGQVLLRLETDHDDDICDAEGEEARLEHRDAAWKLDVVRRHHCVTAMVHWLTLMAPVYAKASSVK